MSRKRREPEISIFTLSQLCEAMENHQSFNQVTVLFNNISMDFSLQYKNQQAILQMPLRYAKECFQFVVDEPNSLSYVNYLLYEKRDECLGKNIKGLGSWLLALIDFINEYFDIRRSRLQNVSTFEVNGDEYSADCLYAKDHHGIGWYMSRGWLVETKPDDPIAKLIHDSNVKIQYWNDWWNEFEEGSSQMRRELQEIPCGSPESIKMTKLYGVPLQIYTPTNPLAPAMIHMEPLDPRRLEQMETFDYRGSQLILRRYRGALLETDQVSQLFPILRSAYPASVSDDAINVQIQSDIQSLNSERERKRNLAFADVKYDFNKFPSKPNEFYWYRYVDLQPWIGTYDQCLSTVSNVIPSDSVESICATSEMKCQPPSDVYKVHGKNLNRETMAILWFARYHISSSVYWADEWIHETGFDRTTLLLQYYHHMYPSLQSCISMTEYEPMNKDLQRFVQGRRDVNWQKVVESLQYVCLAGNDFVIPGKWRALNSATIMFNRPKIPESFSYLIMTFTFPLIVENVQLLIVPWMVPWPTNNWRPFSSNPNVVIHEITADLMYNY